MDRFSDEQNKLITGSLAVLAVIGIGFSLSYTKAVMIPFVLAVFLTSVVSPLADLLIVRARFPRALAVVVTLLLLIMVMVFFSLIVIDAVQNILKSVGEYSTAMTGLSKEMLEELEAWNIDIDGQEIVTRVQGEVPRIATSIVGSLTGLLSQGVLVFIFVGFLLAGRNPRLIRTGVYADIDTEVRRYIGTKLVISGVTGVLVWMILRMFQLEMASVFGLLAFMLNFIPSVGSIIATLLPLPTAVAQFSDQPLYIAAIVGVPGAIQLTIGNVIEPKLMGDGLKLHPVTILLSLAIWGLLWGPVGMLLAVPMTAVLRIVLDQFEITKPTSRLLAGTLPGMANSD